MRERSEWRDRLWMSGGFWILLMISIIGTPLSVIALLFLPLPFLVFTAKHTVKSGAVFAGIHVLLTTLFGLFWALVTFIAAGTGWAMGQYHHQQKKSIHALLLVGTLSVVIGIIGMIGLLSAVFDFQLAEALDRQWENSIAVYEQWWTPLGIHVSDSELEQVKQSLLSLLPVTLLMVASVTALVNHGVGRLILSRMGVPTVKLPPFHEWQFPRSTLIWYIVSVVVIVSSEPTSFWHSAALTANWALQLLFVLQALSLGASLFVRVKNIPQNVLILFAVLLSPTMLIATVILFMPLSFIGMVDVGFRFRDKLKRKD